MPTIFNPKRKKAIFINTGGTVSPTPTPPSFSNTKSLNFDGSDDYIDFGVVNQVQTFSVSMWVNPTSWSATRVAIQMGQSSNYGLSFWFMSDGTLRCIGANGTNDSYFGSSVANADTYLPSGSWGHILFTHEQTGTGATQKIYINGTLRNTYTSTTNPYTINYLGNPLYIARRNNETAYWSGNIDEVSIFNAVKVVADVSDGTVPIDLKGKANLVSWWRMGDKVTSFPTIPDQEGSNDGTANNMDISDIETDVPS